MKRLTIIVAAILVWQFSQAKVITEEQARRYAADFFAAAEARTKASVLPEDLRMVWTFPAVVTKAPAAPALYVFERPSGGYAVVAGDDVAKTILGYSLTGRFPTGNMPENMREMFEWYTAIINFAREQGWSSAATKASDPDPSNSVVLETARWNQWYPFNILAPQVDGKEVPIGCVATATAIIMQYHKWPNKGTGTLPGYKIGKVQIDDVKLGHSYNWSLMPSKSGNFSTAEAEQIARLLYDVAVMYQMNFAPDGSAASTWDTWKLTQYFGYDKSLVYYSRDDDISDERWEQLLRDEIDAGRPVLHDGFNDEAGHAFVIDGYSSNQYFSINYGWGGGSEFYTLTPVEGHKKDLTSFNKSQDAVCRIMPDSGGVPDATLYMYSEGPTLPYDFERGKEFSLVDCYVYAGTYVPVDYTYTYDFAYVLYDSKGKVKEVISPEMRMDLKANDMYYTDMPDVACVVSKELADGDRITLATKDPDSGEWKPVSEKHSNEISFTKKPLSEIVKVGYDGKRSKNDMKNLDGEDLNLYFYAPKDIPWALYYEEDLNEPLLHRWIYSSWYGFDGACCEQRLKEDGGTTYCNSHIWVPSGNYIAVFRNPLTGEKLKLRLEL